MAGTRRLILLASINLLVSNGAIAQSYQPSETAAAPGKRTPSAPIETKATTPSWGESFGDMPVPIQQNRPRSVSDIDAPAAAPRTTYSGSPQPDANGQSLFNNDDYLNGVGSGRPPVGLYSPQKFARPQNTNWTPQPDRLDYKSPYNQGFFEGKVNPNDKLEDIQPLLRVGPLPTHEDPAWAKQKLKMRYYQDGQEHFGNDDPYGFFNQ